MLVKIWMNSKPNTVLIRPWVWRVIVNIRVTKVCFSTVLMLRASNNTILGTNSHDLMVRDKYGCNHS